MIEIQITFENGGKLITSPERLRLAPSKDANDVTLVAGGHGTCRCLPPGVRDVV
jgi:hypothetical protein